MNAAIKFEQDRLARNKAKGNLDAHVELVRDDLDTRSIGGRIADKVTADASDAAAEVVDVARSNKPVIAGTVIALVAWMLRYRISDLITRLTGVTILAPYEEKEADW